MIEIIKCGPQTTIQDIGRDGYSRYGVGKSGALDQYAYRLGNILLGNKNNEAAIESLVHPLVIKFNVSLDLAIVGADAHLSCRDGSQEFWPSCSRFKVKPDEQLSIGPSRGGSISYVCVRGGIEVDRILGSRSTDLKGKFGGHQGRMLQSGDRLAVAKNETRNLRSLGVHPLRMVAEKKPLFLRMLANLEFEQLDHNYQEKLFTTDWVVSRQSNRVGSRLEGSPLYFSPPIEMLSHGLMPGLVQLPPNGAPIVLLGDAQVSGGYPRLGYIIEEDLRLIVQARPGQTIRLVRISYDEASRIKESYELYFLKVEQMLEAQHD